MDRLESLGSTLSQITLYDIKSMYNQAKNVVLNVSEMEAKVREATNDDPWGASSTLMQEIAQGTFSFQYFNEIMPAIYSRFMEKEARQWRQIYKSLQLLEYLIKHGSERVVDDARSHASTIRMLRNFHYIDDKGKDEGINVRNRAKELVELLSDVEKIRNERRKAKANKNKYIGTGNDGMSFTSGSGGRYGGFGSDSLGGGGGGGGYDRDYGNQTGSYSSGGGGSSGSGFRDESRRAGGFEEYNAGDDEVSAPRRSGSLRTTSASTRTTQPRPSAKAKEVAPPPVPEVDLLGGLDEEPASNGLGAFATNKALPVVSPTTSAPAPVSLDDDDFADFQAAPVSPQTTASSSPHTRGPSKPTLMDMLGSNTASNPPVMGGMHRSTPSIGTMGGSSFMQPQQPKSPFGMTGGTPMMSPTSSSTPSTMRSPTTPGGAAASKPAGGFDDLWNLSLGGSTAAAKPAGVGAKSMNDLQKEKAMAGLWGPAKSGTGGAPKPAAAPSDPFGSFGSGAPASSGGDDLLL